MYHLILRLSFFSSSVLGAYLYTPAAVQERNTSPMVASLERGRSLVAPIQQIVHQNGAAHASLFQQIPSTSVRHLESDRCHIACDRQCVQEVGRKCEAYWR